MLSIVHGTTGAFIASIIPNPFIAIPIAIFLHYLFDYIPHWDVGQGLRTGKKKKSHSFFQELLVDLPLSIALTYYLFQNQSSFNIYVWLGWFAGLLPDFIEFPKLFLKNNHPLLELHSAFHKRFHISIPDKFWGLLPQISVILAILVFK